MSTEQTRATPPPERLTAEEIATLRELNNGTWTARGVKPPALNRIMTRLLDTADRERQQAEEITRLKHAITSHLELARVSFSGTPYRRSLEALRALVAPEGTA